MIIACTCIVILFNYNNASFLAFKISFLPDCSSSLLYRGWIEATSGLWDVLEKINKYLSSLGFFTPKILCKMAGTEFAPRARKSFEKHTTRSSPVRLLR